MSVIEISDLNKIYRGKKGTRVQALTKLNLSVLKGEVFGFLGPNGAGKSTTIKILTGQIKPTKGLASINGVDVSAPESRKKIGYLPENPSFFQFMSAYDYLHFTGRVHGMKDEEIKKNSKSALSLLGLEAVAKRPIRGYSKGMVQRLGLAQAMLHDPDLYILDEPMSGLDPLGRALVKKIVLQLKKRGKTVFFSTHITVDVEEICDRVAVLVHGKLAALENVATLLQRGIEGYSVFGKDGSGDLKTYNVSPEELKGFLERLLREGFSVERIEPVRQNLEAFFLETVEGTRK
jgi:ABC-2 type transport system ATP-binding protein